jgi:predicted transcriptional regulator of viral defense system
MNQINKLAQLNTASFFNKETLSRVIEIEDDALSADIQRWIKRGNLIQLKKGFYVVKEYYQSLGDKQAYVEFLANILKKPSYLSSEYVLQKYSILTESVFAITSITRKKTRIYQNKFGMFIYSNIKDELFTGFKIISKGGFEIKEATKAKALFDFLYLRLWRVPEITREIVESYRFNLNEVSNEDFVEFESYIKLSGLSKFMNLTDILKEIANDN